MQFYQRALELNDLASAKVLLAELEILKLSFKALANRFAMGARHLGMLQAMLDRITVEFSGNVPLQTVDRVVPPVCSLDLMEKKRLIAGTEYATTHASRFRICIPTTGSQF